MCGLSISPGPERHKAYRQMGDVVRWIGELGNVERPPGVGAKQQTERPDRRSDDRPRESESVFSLGPPTNDVASNTMPNMRWIQLIQ